MLACGTTEDYVPSEFRSQLGALSLGEWRKSHEPRGRILREHYIGHIEPFVTRKPGLQLANKRLHP